MFERLKRAWDFFRKDICIFDWGGETILARPATPEEVQSRYDDLVKRGVLTEIEAGARRRYLRRLNRGGGSHPIRDALAIAAGRKIATDFFRRQEERRKAKAATTA